MIPKTGSFFIFGRVLPHLVFEQIARVRIIVSELRFLNPFKTGEVV